MDGVGNGGADRRQNLPATGLTALSCATSAFCLAAFVTDSGVVSSEFNGTSWSPTVPITGLDAC